MIDRARRSVPGVIVSLLLAAPAFAAAPATEASETPHARHAPVRGTAARKRAPARPALHSASYKPTTTGAWVLPAVWSQTGIASWYGGKRWQGKLTASGARYDEAALTAAHASLPIGSHVRVVVADTGRSVVVTINDRPGTRKRIIDLSRGAAEALGILQRGVARVTLLPA